MDIDPNSENDRYLIALAHLVDKLPNTESIIFTALCAVVGVSHDIGYAIFSGVRAKEAIANIQRIYQVKKIAIPEELSGAFAQFSIVNDVRNNIIHYGIRKTWLDGASVERRRQVKKGVPSKISDKIIWNMLHDLQTIENIIHKHILADQDWLRMTADIATPPWQYIPRPQETQGRSSRNSTPKPPRQPEASHKEYGRE